MTQDFNKFETRHIGPSLAQRTNANAKRPEF